ncbi:MAG: hypothetical protein IKM24_08800, partial [Clostridia bacterium]|nr:hypothetical protein [Clostridia bacterium]
MDVKNKRKWLLLLVDLICFFIVYIATAFIATLSSTSVDINKSGYIINLVIFLLLLFVSRVVVGV